MKWFKDQKIALKIIVLFAAIPVVLILFSGYMFIRISTQGQISRIKENIKIEASDHLTAIDIILDKNYHQVRSFSNDAVFTSKTVTPEKITDFLKDKKKKYNYVSLSYFDMNRIRIADTENRHLGEKYDLIGYWNDVLNGKISSGSDVRISDDFKKPVIFFASPAKNNKGRAIGVIVAIIDFEDIAYIIDESYVEYSHSTLLDKDRNILYSNCEELKNLVLKDKIKEMPSINKAFLGLDGVIEEYSPYHKKEFITIYMHQVGWQNIRSNNWVLVISIEKENVLAPIRNLKNTVIGLVISMLFMIILVTLYITRFVTKPIIELNKTAQKIKSGDLTQKAEVYSNDEAGQLAVVFNHMADNLKEPKDKLEIHNEGRKKKIIEKTEDLPESKDAIVCSERLVLGQLASGVAHELKNPLGVMKNAVHSISMTDLDKADPTIKENLNILSNEIENSNNIIADLLESNRIEKPILKLENINMIIKEMLASLKIPSNIEIITDLADDLPVIEVDILQIRQVFSNITDNAIQAMKEGGKLTVSTSVSVYVMVSFQDTGIGIPKEKLKKIFRPLYTTQNDRTGLGLSVCASMIEGHDGEIEVRSEEGTGTKFTVKLPVERN